VACGFRDHALSDLIGFVYASWPADHAADDFVARLAAAGRQAAARNGGEEPTIFVILDGENAWEHFEGGGRPFLRALYKRLSGHPELRTVTMADACTGAREPLDGIFPGSWIDANFYIWIGHQDDVRAWSQVADARAALEAAAPQTPPETLVRARQEMFIAEGSDWCWWYGDDHSSEHDADFDELFRRHLRNVYRLLGRPIPDELFISNISAGTPPVSTIPPTAFLSPRIDGEESSYFEWLCAGILDTRVAAGAMHQTDRKGLLTQIRFGFDRERLLLRLDTLRAPQRLLASGWSVMIAFLRPAGLRLAVSGDTGQPARARLRRRDAEGGWSDVLDVQTEVAAGAILEIAVPLAALQDGGATDLSFTIAVIDAEGNEIERHPNGRPLDIQVPDERFESRNWTA
jgi:hypothetical protein